MNPRTKKILITSIVLVGLFLLYKFADEFSPGSYGYAEMYELDYPEDKVIEAVKKLKDSDSTLIVPNALVDGKSNPSDHWYYFYFYDRENERVLLTWTRRAGRTKTTFALVSIRHRVGLGNWKDVNNDLASSENREVIKNFEEKILKRVKENLDK